jgi:hypothetical protein
MVGSEVREQYSNTAIQQYSNTVYAAVRCVRASADHSTERELALAIIRQLHSHCDRMAMRSA